MNSQGSMRRNRRGPKLRALLLFAACFLCIAMPSFAGTMTSTNYTIFADDFSGGGAYSSSGSYKLTDTVSEFAPPTAEHMSSANYAACAGFECLQQAGFLTLAIAISASPCTSSTTSTPPISVGFGTISTGAVSTSSFHLCVRASTNISNTVTTTVSDAYGGLKSLSRPTDLITSQTATLTAGVQGYGICSTNTSGGFTAASPYNGTCDGTHHQVGALQIAQQTIYTATGPLDNAYGDMLAKASISNTTRAHNDYSDMIAFVVTATY